MSYPPAQFGSNAYLASGNNTNAVVTVNGTTEYGLCLSGIAWSYNGTPTPSGRLTVNDSVLAANILDIDITTSGAGFIPFHPALEGQLGANLVITLYAGGANIIGKVTLLGVWKRPQ